MTRRVGSLPRTFQECRERLVDAIEVLVKGKGNPARESRGPAAPDRGRGVQRSAPSASLSSSRVAESSPLACLDPAFWKEIGAIYWEKQPGAFPGACRHPLATPEEVFDILVDMGDRNRSGDTSGPPFTFYIGQS